MPRTLPVRIGLAPGWGATAVDAWYPWLDQARRALGRSTFDVIAGGPEPRTDRWPKRLAEWLGTDPAVLARTLLVGQSTGCQAWLRALSTLPPTARVAGLVAVAGWWTLDDPWPPIVPWTRADDFNLRRAREATAVTEVLLGTGDPYTADTAANAALWESRMGARVQVIPDAGHFVVREAPPVLDTLRRLWL